MAFTCCQHVVPWVALAISQTLPFSFISVCISHPALFCFAIHQCSSIFQSISVIPVHRIQKDISEHLVKVYLHYSLLFVSPMTSNKERHIFKIWSHEVLKCWSYEVTEKVSSSWNTLQMGGNLKTRVLSLQIHSGIVWAAHKQKREC